MTKSYTVKNTNILHNQKTYGAGSTIELTDEAAAKIADYITPIESSTQDNSSGTNSTSVKEPVSANKKSSKKTDKSANTPDSSDASTTTTDTTPTSTADTASLNTDSVSPEDAASGAAQQEIKNAKTVQTPSN